MGILTEGLGQSLQRHNFHTYFSVKQSFDPNTKVVINSPQWVSAGGPGETTYTAIGGEYDPNVFIRIEEDSGGEAANVFLSYFPPDTISVDEDNASINLSLFEDKITEDNTVVRRLRDEATCASGSFIDTKGIRRTTNILINHQL